MTITTTLHVAAPPLPEQDDPRAPQRVWRYYLTDPRGAWLATVFLDGRGQIAIHSVYGPASFDWADADLTDPRRTFASQDEGDEALIVERLSAWHPATRKTVRSVARAVFPALRAALRQELAEEARPR